MGKVIHLIYGDWQFVLEMRTLRRVKETSSVDRVATHESLIYNFPSLERYCTQRGIEFERGISPGNFSVEGEGFYLVSISEVPEVMGGFERRGFELSEESITWGNSFLQ